MKEQTNIKQTNQADNAGRFDAFVTPTLNTFYNDDCMNWLPKCPPNFFELAIVDPPYGINYDEVQNINAENGRIQNKGKWKKYHKSNWDVSPPAKEYYRELFRVSKNQIIWGGNFFLDNLNKTKCMLIWDKVQRDNRADCEIAWTNLDKPSKVFRMSRIDAYVNKCDVKIHPTQKPIELYKWILFNYARAGDKILDTHVGSGSSLIACIEGGFNYWGTEIDKDYYEAAQKRIARAFRQYDLNLE